MLELNDCAPSLDPIPSPASPAVCPPSFAKSQISSLPRPPWALGQARSGERITRSSAEASSGAEANTRRIHHLILFYSPFSASLHTTALLFIAPSCSLGVLLASSPPQSRSLGASSSGQGGGWTTSLGSPQRFSKRRARAAEEGR